MDNLENAYCRLCAESKSQDILIDMRSDEQKRQEITTKLYRINASTDFNIAELPKTICLVCLVALDKAFDLVCGVEKAQAVLQDLFKIKIKKEETYERELSEGESTNEKDHIPVPVKLETESDDCDTSVQDVENVFNSSPQGNDQETIANPSSLDSIPLSHLKLTWKNYEWQCSYCETRFQSADDLKTHSMEYHRSCNAYRCTDCNIRKFRLDAFIIHVRRHRKNLKLSCYMCFQWFANPRRVNCHKIRYHHQMTHVCPGCNTSFQSEDELNQHTKDYFKDGRSRQIPINSAINNDGLSCYVCKKTFKSKGSLGNHLLTHTERTRNHTCDKCGKGFLNKQTLAGHMLLHTELRPYQCEICKKAFKTLVHLRNHVGVHNNHKPFACDQCGRCFRLRKQLESHRIIHTDLLPYVCNFCSKQFRFKSILNQHIRQHTGFRPYSCNTCQRDFTNWPNYNKHMKRRHGTDMAKKKHTPDGVCPIDPVTGEVVVLPETNKTTEWKEKVMAQRRPGRPRKDKQNKEILKETG